MVDTNQEGIKSKADVDFDALLDDFLNNELAGIEDYKPSEEVKAAEEKAKNPAELNLIIT